MNELDPLNEYLDGDEPESVNLSSLPREEVARHLVIDAVTRHLSTVAGGNVGTTVRTGMVAVAEYETRQRRMRTRNRLFGSLVAAAAVVVTAIVLFWEQPGLQPLLHRIHMFIRSGLDREYKLSLRGNSVPHGVKCTLFVRGTNRYASRLQLHPFGGSEGFEIWQGFNGEEHWLVPPDVFGMFDRGAQTPVFVSTKGLQDLWDFGELSVIRRFARGLDQMESALKVFALMELLEENYSVETTPDTVPKLRMKHGQVDITAYRKPQADITIPDTIRMIVDEATGAVHSIILKFVELPDAMDFQSPFTGIRYDLVRETLNGDGLYDHQSHHDDRPVRYK